MFELNSLLVALVLVDFLLLGSSRLSSCIRQVAIQGVLLGLLVVAEHGPWASPWRVWVLAIGSTAVKAVVFPYLLHRALRTAQVRRELQPYVGFTASILLGVLGLGFALWLASRLPLPEQAASPMLVPVALFTMLVGLFLIVARRTALSQVLGYLVLENGIFAFGLALTENAPLSVEIGVLLDIFVAVFIMGIAIHHISREFDHIDTDRLTELKDVAE
jgi:hydrogenase-4 component E